MTAPAARGATPGGPTPDAGGVRLRGVTVDRDGAPVVEGVDLVVRAGGWTALLGPNGAGKSTLLRAIAGLLPCTGDVLVDGRPVGGLAPRERAELVALAPQAPVIPEAMPVSAYVMLGRTRHRSLLASPSRRDRAAVEQALERLDLERLAPRPIGTLSGGERQRAVLARALAQEARVLLLDEPTTALDLGHAQELLELVDRLRREDGLTVISPLHDLPLAAQYADRVLLLDGGRAVAEGRPEAVLTSEALARHFGARADVAVRRGVLRIDPRRDHAPPPPQPAGDAPDPRPAPGALRPAAPASADPDPVPVLVDTYADGGDRWPVLHASLPDGWRAMASTVVGGGLTQPRWWLNAQVRRFYDRTDPEVHAHEIATALGHHGPGVAMLTAADVRDRTVAVDDGVLVVATVGLGLPVPAARSREEIAAEAIPTGPGTINLLVVVPEPLAEAALVNAVLTATEAKTQALQEAGVPGTGTSSDAICVCAPDGPGPGDPYGGPRSIWGARIARAVHAAVAEGTAGWVARYGHEIRW